MTPASSGCARRAQLALGSKIDFSRATALSRTQDIACLILQYLQDEGYTTSFLTMQDETKIKLAEKQTQRSYFKRIRKAILGAHVPVSRTHCRDASSACDIARVTHECHPVPQTATGWRWISCAAR